jgi:pimeloyl-ACP methyl ester carboxylesterase
VRRVLRVAGAVVVGLVLASTLAAVAVDLSPVGAARPATKLYGGPFVRVGSTLVAYRHWGSRGSPIVLLGGAAEPSWVWHRVGPLLAAGGHRVFALDLPPFGYTERNVPPTMAGWLSLLRGFERRLGIVRPELVGHSLGAGIAVEESIERPRDVGRVVLLDGDALAFGGRGGWGTHLLMYPWYDAALRLLTGWDWLVGRVLRNAWGPGAPSFPHSMLVQFERPFRVSGTAGELRALVAHGIPGVRTSDLHRVRTPRAVVWGAHDDVYSVASGRRTAAALDVSLHLVPRAGHLSMLARPRAVARLILAS